MERTRAATKRELRSPNDDGTLERANAMAPAKTRPSANSYHLRGVALFGSLEGSPRAGLEDGNAEVKTSLSYGGIVTPLASGDQGCGSPPGGVSLSRFPGITSTNAKLTSIEQAPSLTSSGIPTPPTSGEQGHELSPDGANLPVSPGVLLARSIPDSVISGDLREPCRHLFDLPQELVDMIFDYAYPTIENFRIRSRERWIEDINNSYSRRGYCGKAFYSGPKSYPGSQMNDFLGVNKAFFHAAATAYIRNQTWDLASVLAAVKVVDYTPLRNKPSFLSSHITALMVTMPTDDLIAYEDCTYAFPALKSIDFRPRTYYFHRHGDKQVVRDTFTGEDWEKISDFQVLKEVRGLKEFSINVDAPSKYQPNVVAGVWESNMSKMETLLRPLVTQPKPKIVQSSSSCCGFADTLAFTSMHPELEHMQASEHIRLASLKMMTGPRKQSDYFEEDVLERTDAVVIDAFMKDPDGFMSWARKMKRMKDNIEASKSMAK